MPLNDHPDYYRASRRALRAVNRVPLLERFAPVTLLFLGWLIGLCWGVVLGLVLAEMFGCAL